MLAWMEAEGIGNHYAKFVEHRFDGRALAEFKLVLLSPQNDLNAYLSFFRDGLGILEIGEMFRIIGAIRKLKI